MTVDQVEELIRKYLSTGLAVVVILIGPATVGANGKPQVITVTPATPSTSAQAAAPASSQPGATSPTSAEAAISPTATQPAAAAPSNSASDTAPAATTSGAAADASTAGATTADAGQPTGADTATQPTDGNPAAQATGANPDTQSTDENRSRSSGSASHTTAPKHTRTAAPNNTAVPNDTAAPNNTDGQTTSSETTTEASGADPGQRGSAAPTTGAPAQTQDQPQAGEGTTAAAKYGWGTPNREDDFSGDLSGWGLYDGPGHAGNGRRSPSAATIANGVLTIQGDAQGTTEGMAWDNGQKYGRWEGRVKAPASDPTYNALLLLWPDAENFPVGGEIDFMEMTDNTRQSTNLFLHYGSDNSQVHGEVKIDATQWHNWAVEWTPKGVTTYVDGNPWWHTDDASILPPGPMHLCIQLDWFPGEGHGAVAPSQMQVDWVRQYPVDSSGAAKPASATGTTATGTTATAATPTADTVTTDPRGSVMRAVIQRMFGW